MEEARQMSDLPFVLEPETPADAEAILRLNDRVFGPGRFARTAYRVRETTPPDLSLSFVAWIGSLIVGANAMTPIFVGETPALLLGPLIVEPVFRSQGIGEALVNRSLDAAREKAARSPSSSATNPTTAAWVLSAPPADGLCCPALSIRRGCSIVSCSRGRSRGSRGRCGGREASVAEVVDP